MLFREGGRIRNLVVHSIGHTGLQERKVKTIPTPGGLPPLEEFPWRPLILLNSNDDKSPSCIAGGKAGTIRCDEPGEAFRTLKACHDQNPDWLFGYLGYDLKNEVESLRSENPDPLEFPVMYFFRPAFVAWYEAGVTTLRILPGQVSEEELLAIFEKRSGEEREGKDGEPSPGRAGEVRDRTGKARYIQDVLALKEHIEKGDIYEANYCREFYLEGHPLNSIATYRTLNE